MKKIVTLTLLGLATKYCAAQVYLSPVVGYQVDLTNSHFQQFNTGLQFSNKFNSIYELIFSVQNSNAIPYHSSDSAFSANPQVPLYNDAKKTIRPQLFSVQVGHRLTIAGRKTKNVFAIAFYTGVAAQKIKVSYDYDKTNYTVLNPDATQKRTGLFLSGGFEYTRILTNGRILLQLNYAAPTIGEKINYPSSFDFMAPLAFNVGYSILLKHNRHEKK